MKQLLFTFFAIILCYSLFLDNEPESSATDKLNYIYEGPAIHMTKDTLGSYTYTYFVVYHRMNLGNLFSADKEIGLSFRH